MESKKIFNKFNIYWLIIFVSFYIVNILNYYLVSIKIVKPIILFTITFVSLLFQIKNNCSFNKLPLLQIFNRSISLLSIFLYSEYTISCVPIIKLLFGNLINLPNFGLILKTIFSFLIMFFINFTIDLFHKKDNSENSCNIQYESTNIIISIIIFSFIVINTYLNLIKPNV